MSPSSSFGVKGNFPADIFCIRETIIIPKIPPYFYALIFSGCLKNIKKKY